MHCIVCRCILKGWFQDVRGFVTCGRTSCNTELLRKER